jgi:hypothetical protein
MNQSIRAPGTSSDQAHRAAPPEGVRTVGSASAAQQSPHRPDAHSQPSGSEQAQDEVSEVQKEACRYCW